MKTCNKCQQSGSFYKDKNCKDGFRLTCKACDVQRRIIWHKANKDKDCLSKRKYSTLNKEKIKQSQKQLEVNNPGYYAQKAKESRLRRGEKHKEYVRNYDKVRRMNDPLYKLRRSASNGLASAITKNGFKKTSKVSLMLGCNWIYFKQYIESQFILNMNWTNYGKDGWTIDHICPCSQAQNEQELIKLQHYMNLQPSFDNFTKSDKATIEATRKCNKILGRNWI